MASPSSDHPDGNDAVRRQTVGAHERRLARFQAYDAARVSAGNQIVRGLGWLVIAALLTGVGYLVSAGRELFYILWGAMAWGAVELLLGIYRLIRSRRGMKETSAEPDPFTDRPNHPA